MTTRHSLQHFVCAMLVVFGLCAPDLFAAQAATQDDTPFSSVSAAQPWGNADQCSGPHGFPYLELAAAGYSALLTDFTDVLPPFMTESWGISMPDLSQAVSGSICN